MKVKFSTPWLETPNFSPALRTAPANSPIRSRFGPIFMALNGVTSLSHMAKLS